MGEDIQIASLAAGLYVLIIIIVIAFQICLIAGAPWGPLTQGGRHSGPLPTSGRVLAFISILVLAFMAGGITSAIGLKPSWPIWTSWVAVGVQALSMIANWITPSQRERMLWGPVTSVMLALAVCAVVL